MRTASVSFFIGFLVVTATAVSSGPAGELYVDDDAPIGGDGLSWESPFAHLQDALTVAASHPDQAFTIRIGQGLYRPDETDAAPDGTGDRTIRFEFAPDLVLLGGYAGFGADDPDVRDSEAYPTILTGDLAEDDLPGFENRFDNSERVVYVSDAIDRPRMIDGLIIEAGYTVEQTEFCPTGAGILMSNTSLTVRACVIRDCFAGEPSNCSAGGGISAFNSNLTVDAALFEGCVTTHSGGAIYFHDDIGRLDVRESCFVGNLAGSNPGNSGGGAIASWAEDGTLIRNCSFIDNAVIEPNGGLGYGGEVSVAAGGQIVNCSFTGNSSDLRGGAIWVQSAMATIANCLIIGNAAGSSGGGAGGNFSGRLMVRNCTIAENASNGPGAGIFGLSDVGNSILWANVSDEAEGAEAQIAGDEITLHYSCVEGLAGAIGGIGNTGADPAFLDPGMGNYRLAPGSPCVDAGANSLVPRDALDLDDDGDLVELLPYDLDGNPRFSADPVDFDPGCGVPVVVDMGAYEDPFDPVDTVLFADLDADGIVGARDLAFLLANWGPCDPGCCLADLHLDGVVDGVDLGVLLAAWSESDGR